MFRTVAALSAAALWTALVVGSTVAPAQAAPSAPDRPLRVMSFNIHAGIGEDDRLDLDRVAGVIRDSGADVVGLQEVDRHWSARSDFVDQASALARALRMNVVYGANLDLDPLQPGEPRRQYGTAILSQTPILDSENTLLPRTGNLEQRGLLRARTVVRGVPLQVYNTHLQHNSAAERQLQADAIRDIVGTPDESVVLLGDLNAVPEAPEIATILTSLVDAWERAGIGNGYTISADNPTRRIDYVMTSEDVVARSAAVLTTDASDHLPVVADVLLPGNRVGVGRR
jgi:endonuclease/exonuclease/phosphatase family metal-dependent hydrolase